MSVLEVNNIRKSFGKVDVLKGVSFSLEQGQVLSLIGSSGSGKTTLLRCMTFLERAEEGTVAVNGNVIFDAKNTVKISAAEQRRRQLNFGLVFQNFNLFPQYNVLDNVCLAPRLQAKERPDYKANHKQILAEIEENAYSLLERVGLSAKVKNYPCELSGGQQQRVAIARALAMQPDILCFDEPTSALDPELTGEVLKVIRELSERGRTMIVVTHEMEFARQVSDDVIFMADGVIEEEGNPLELFSNPKSEKLRSFLNGINK